MNSTQTYSIPTDNLTELQRVIARLNTKATKLGVAPIALTVGTTEVRQQVKKNQYGEAIIGQYITYTVAAVTISGAAPALNGWTFIAKVENAGSEIGNLVSIIPGESLPEQYRSVDPTICQHCNLIRTRLATFILRNEAGEYIQVGRNCLGDFLGGVDPHSVAAYAELLATAAALAEGSEDEYRRSGRGITALDPVDFLSHVAESIVRGGWVSRTVARDYGKQATADDAWGQIAYPPIKAEDRWTPSAESFATAEAALAWYPSWLDKDSRNDYEHNMAVALSTGIVTSKTAGLVASLIPAYLREIGRIAERQARAEKAPSAFVGTVGKREIFSATLVHTFDTDSIYGTRRMMKFVANGKDTLVWWTSPGTLDAEIGEVVSLKATVKAHETYKGECQTTITRATAL